MDFSNFLTLDRIVNTALFIAKPLLILIVCKIIIGIVLKILDGIFTKTHLDRGIQTFAKSAAKIAMWALTIIMIADAFGIETASLVAIVGVASLALSMSVQNILTNVFSGITILLSKPFKVGDFVDVCGVAGTVTAIDLMRTTINTPDNKEELIPNADIVGNKVSNYSAEELRRVDLKVTASYDNSTKDVKQAIMSVIDSDTRIKKDETHLPFVRLSGYNANDIEYTIRIWVDNSDYWDVYFDTLENIREAFNNNNIEFSYPHTVIHMTKDNIK